MKHERVLAAPLALAASFVLSAGSLNAQSTCMELATDFASPVPGVSDEVWMIEPVDLGQGSELLVGGEFEFAFDQKLNGLGVWNGSGWRSLGGGIAGDYPASSQPAYARAALQWDDGGGEALYLGGRFRSAGNVDARNVARWDGTSWSALGTGPFSDHQVDGVHALAVFDDGDGPKLYAAGVFTTPWANIACWDGTSWSSVGGGLSGEANALAVFDDGSGPALYVGGAFDFAGGVQVDNLARWDGASWSSVGGGVDDGAARDVVNDLLVWDSGVGPRLFVTGLFDTVGDAIPATGFAAWDGASWSLFDSIGFEGFQPIGEGLALGNLGSGERLILLGRFAAVGGIAAFTVAGYDGTSWEAYSGSFATPSCCSSPRRRAVAAYASDRVNEEVIVGGWFSSADGNPVMNLTRRGPNQWTGFGPRGEGLRLGSVDSLQVVDFGTGNVLVAAGSFALPEPASGAGLARWNGVRWRCFQAGQNCVNMGSVPIAAFDDGTGEDLYYGTRKWQQGAAVDTSGPDITSFTELAVLRYEGQEALYAAGEFLEPGGGTSTRIFRRDASAWTPIGGPLDVNQIRALAVFDDGDGPRLFAAGFASGIFRFDGASWKVVGDTPVVASVYSLIVFDDGTGPALYAGKDQRLFAGPLEAANVIRYDGTDWTSVGDSSFGILDSDQWGIVYDLEVYDDGTGPALYAGGRFDGALRRWDGTGWNPVFDRVDLPNLIVGGSIVSMTVYDDGDGPALMLGGRFDNVGDTPSYRIAEYRPSSGVGCPNPTGVTFCAGDDDNGSCPCANPGQVGHGCANAANDDGGRLTGAGDPAVGVTLRATRLSNSGTALLIRGTPSTGGTPFGDGLLCVGGSVRRLRAQTPSFGRTDFAVNSPLAETVSYQVIFRTATSVCGGGQAFNLTNGFQVSYP